jgi:hypothetical protein
LEFGQSIPFTWRKKKMVANMSQHALQNLSHHAAVVGSIATIAGNDTDYVMSLVLKGIADAGKAAHLKPAEIGARVGRSKSAVYDDARQELVAPELRDTLLPETVMNVFLSEGCPLTAAQIASIVGRDERRIETLLGSMSLEYLQRVTSGDETTYALKPEKVAYVQPYPDGYEKLAQRRDKAKLVGDGADETKSFSLVVKLTEPQAAKLYSFVRDYANKLPSEERLNALVADTKTRGGTPRESTLGALLLWSPDSGEADATSHYRTCHDLYCDRRYEMIPYRHPLDEIAIEEFYRLHFEAVIDEVSSLLGRYRGVGDAGQAYRMSFLCRRIGG